MGWVTCSLYKSRVQRQLNDNSLEQMQLRSKLRKLSRFAAAIGTGKLFSPESVAGLGSELLGEACNYMINAHETAKICAQDQADYYIGNFSDITAEQYATSGISSQAALYFNADGTMDYESTYNNFYEQNLKEYAEEFKVELNEAENAIQEQLDILSAEQQALQADLEAANQGIQQGQSNSAIKLA